jgi:hypothetical protein
MIYADDDHVWIRPRGSVFTAGPGSTSSFLSCHMDALSLSSSSSSSLVLLSLVAAYKIPAFNDPPEVFNVTLLENANNPLAVHSSKAVGEPPFFMGRVIVKKSGGSYGVCLCAFTSRAHIACSFSFFAQVLLFSMLSKMLYSQLASKTLVTTHTLRCACRPLVSEFECTAPIHCRLKLHLESLAAKMPPNRFNLREATERVPHDSLIRFYILL